jgi:hypothetical protein
MNIKIDIELTPQELRQFIGLPDVAGLQDDMIHFVRDKVARGIETVDVDALKQGIQSTRAWKRLMSVIGPVEPEITVTPRPRRRRKKRTSKPRSTAHDEQQTGGDSGSETN